MASGGPNAAARRAATRSELPGMTAAERKKLKKQERKLAKKQKRAERKMARDARAAGNAKNNKKQASELLAKIKRLETAAKNSWTKAQKNRALYLSLVQEKAKEDGIANPETLSTEQLFTIETALPPWAKQVKDKQAEASADSTSSKRKRGAEENKPETEIAEDTTAGKERKKRGKAKTDEFAKGEDVAPATEHVTTKDAVSRTDANGTAAETEELKAQPEPKKMKKDKKKKKDKKDAAKTEAAVVEETTTEEPPVADTSTEVKEKKKRRKANKDELAKEETDEAVVVEGTEDAIAEVKEKKKKAKKVKKDKSAEEEVANGGTTMALSDKPAAASEEREQKPSPEQEINEKSSKKRKRSKKPESADDKDGEGTEELERWNVQGLEGGEARQSKYLRLLGGKKAGLDTKILAAKGPGSTGRERLDTKAVEEELDKQFEAGMKAKHEGGGKKKGLGA